MQNQEKVARNKNSAIRVASAVLACVALLAMRHASAAAVADGSSATFTAGTNGYQAQVPSTSQNLLAGVTPVLTGVAASALGQGGGSNNLALLTDGSYGTVPASGGGNTTEVTIPTAAVVTYTLPAAGGYYIGSIDVFSGWGDNGRMQPRFTVSYATVAAPTTFVTISTVAYNPTGVNSAWIHICDLGLNGVAVGTIQFSFAATQENGYVGYTELAVGGSEVDHSASFTTGSNGYQANVPATSQNLLSGVTPVNTGTAVTAQGGGSGTLSLLTDGSYGTVPAAGSGSPTEVTIPNGAILTYTLPAPGGYNISEVDVFTGWGDNGRAQPRVTVNYATVAAPTVFNRLGSIAYNVGTVNSTWVQLNNLGLGSVNVAAIQFVFPAQQNGYVGYTELSVLGTQATTVSTWTGTTSSDWGVGTNWQSGNIPNTFDTDIFGTPGVTGTVDLGTANRSAAGLTFLGGVNTTIGSTNSFHLTLDNTLNSAPASVNVAGINSINVPVVLNSNLALTALGIGSLTFSGAISENSAGRVLNANAGGTTIFLGSANTYTGGTTLSAGLLNVVTGALGTTGNITFGGGTLQYAAGTASPQDFSGRIKSSTAAISVDVNGNSALFASVLDASNGGGLTLNSSAANGVLTLSAANQYGGATTVSSGTLKLANAAAIPNAAAAGANPVNIAVGATLDLNTNSAALNSLNGAGTVDTLAGGTPTLTIGGNNDNSAFSGVIRNSAGAVSLVKAGTGTATLSGVNTFTGTTAVNGGQLNLMGTGSLAAGSAVIVSANAVLTGTGAANGTVTVNASGHVAPGQNTAGNVGGFGKLSAGNLVLNANSVLDLDVGGSGASDLVAVTNTLTLPASGTVTVNAAFALGYGNGTYKIVSFGSLVNTFTPGKFVLSSTPAATGGTYTFVQGANEIDLVISGASTAGGVFSTAYLGAGNFDTTVGLTPGKTFLNAVNSGGAALSINGIPFDASPTAATSGPTYSVTGQPSFGTPGPTNNVLGNLGTALADFTYGGTPVNLNLSSLVNGQTYILTLYARSFDTAGLRVQNVTTSDGASTSYDVDLGAPSQGYGNLLRYTFVAGTTSETLVFTAVNAANPLHLYAFSTEQVFNNSYTGGSTASTATFSISPPNGAGSNALFPPQNAPTTFTLDIPLTIGHVELDGANAWTFSATAGNSATFQADTGGVSVLASAAGSHLISAPIVLQNNIVKLGGGTLSLQGGVSGTGNLMVNTGLLILGSASNTYTGSTVVSGGTLQISDPNALGTTPNVAVSGTGVFDLHGVTPANPIPASFGGIGLGAGSLTNSASSAATYPGEITSTGAFTIGGVGDITLSGAVSGTITKIGNNTLTLSGVTDNANLTLIVSSGTVVLNKTSSATVHAVGTNGTLIINGGTVKVSGSGGDQIADSGSVIVNLNGTLDLNGLSEAFDSLSGAGIVTNNVAATTAALTLGANGGGSAFAGIVRNGASGAGVVSFTKSGAGTQSFAAAQTYTGPTTVSGGTLAMSAASSSAAAHYNFDNNDASDSSGNGNAGALVGTPAFGTGVFGSAVKFNGTSQYVTVPNSANLQISGNYTVSLWFNQATLTQVANPTLFATRNGGNFTFDLQYSPASGKFHADIGTGGAWLTTGADSSVVSVPANTWTMVTYVVTPAGYTVYQNGGVNIGSGTFAGTPVLNTAATFISMGAQQEGTGAYTANTYFNGAIDEVNVFNSALAVSDVKVLYNAGQAGGVPTTSGTLPPQSVVSLNTSGATLNIAGNSQTVASFTGVTGTSLVLGASVLSLGGDNSSTTFDGIASGSGGLTKAGTGTFTLTGANTYTGLTTVSAGTLAVNNSGTIVGGVTVSANAVLRGTGSVGGATVAGMIYPGTALYTDANPAMNANQLMVVTGVGGGTVDLTNGKLGILLAPGSGGGFVTQLFVPSGGVTLSNSTLSVAVQAATGPNTYGSAGTQYTILSNPTTSITNSFTTLKGASILGSSPTFQVHYFNGGPGGIEVTDGGLAGGTLKDSSNTITPADTVVLTYKGGAVTPVKLDGFAAKREGAGVLVSWNAVSEFQNVGFNVYRRNSKFKIQDSKLTDVWKRVNATLIAGRITNADFKTYRIYDWSAFEPCEYKLESVGVRGDVDNYGRIAEVPYEDAGEALSGDALDAAVNSVAEAAHAERGQQLSAAFARTTANEANQELQSAQPNANTRREEASTSRDHEGAGKRAAASLTYKEDGTLALAGTARDLSATRAVVQATRLHDSQAGPVSLNAAAGARWFSALPAKTGANFTAARVQYRDAGVLRISQASLPAGFNINHVAIQREGRALTPLAMTSDSLIVYGAGYADDYTDKDALFLRATNAATNSGQALHATGLFAGNTAVNVTSPATATADYHDVYFDFNLRPYTFAPWFSSQYLTNGSTQSFTLETPDASSGPGSLTVQLWSLTETDGVPADHALQVFINGQPAGQTTWSGGNKMLELSFQAGSGAWVAGTNQIDLVTPDLPGVDSQICFLHALTASYTRSLNGAAPLSIHNLTPLTQRYEVSAVPSADAWVVDARYPDRAALVAYESLAQADGTYTLRFDAAAGGTGEYLVVPAGQENQPLSVVKRMVKALKGTPYLAVGPMQFDAGVQNLLALHTKEGLKAQFADQEQLFDYYNYGRYGPAGIQNAVRATRPQFVLLVGKIGR